MTDNKPKRSSPFSYRPPVEKRAEFEAMARQSGLSTNAFISECVFGRSRHRPGELQKLAQILGQCAIISDALHDIGVNGAERSILTLEAMATELQLIRTEIMARMGRHS
jgi:hypothetical protein